ARPSRGGCTGTLGPVRHRGRGSCRGRRGCRRRDPAPTSIVTTATRRLRGRLRSYRRRAEAAEQRAWLRALVFKSRDWTAASERRSCLVLAAHPDDETFACGATIRRKTSAGTPVTVLIATD